MTDKLPFFGPCGTEGQRSDMMTEARCAARDLTQTTGQRHTFEWDRQRNGYQVKLVGERQPPLVPLSLSIVDLGEGDRKTLVEELRNFAKEARYSEPDVGVFGSDAMGDALEALAKLVEEAAK